MLMNLMAQIECDIVPAFCFHTNKLIILYRGYLPMLTEKLIVHDKIMYLEGFS